jgi:hypothetical protein
MIYACVIDHLLNETLLLLLPSLLLLLLLLQVIEAHYLYGVDYDNIEIVIHPQSIVHSMIETADSSVLAQVGHMGPSLLVRDSKGQQLTSSKGIV